MSRMYRVKDLHAHQQLDVLVPRLTDAEFEALRESVAERGILSPLLIVREADSFAVIDGGHRLRAAVQHGMTEVPCTLLEGKDEEERIALGIELNGSRRHLNNEQKRQAARGTLRQFPSWSDRHIARAWGISAPTVASVRAEMVALGEIATPDRRTDSTGREQPAHKPRATGSIVGKHKPRSNEVEFPSATESLRQMREADDPPSAVFPEPEDAVVQPPEEDAVRAERVAGMKKFHRTRVPSVVREFLSNAHSVAAMDDEDIAGLETNDVMVEGLEQAKVVIDRIIAKHQAKGARRANA